VANCKPPPLDIQQVTEQHFPRIHRAALMLTGNPWDADDLAQETFLVMARSADRFEGRSSLYTWLYGILLNLERRERRRAGLRRRKLRVVWDNEPQQPRTTPAAETPIEVAEWKRSLWSLVAELPDGQRQTLVLRYSEHLSYDEIASVLNCPLGTVKSRIFHAVAALREMLAGDDGRVTSSPQHPCEDVIHVHAV
jgi:RNA polymerase sigma-70 factor (ECF subfamily)